jgi:hypothetical protein
MDTGGKDEEVWQSRFDQLNSFEKILTDNGITIVKFMLHSSRDEQKRRLQARLEDPEKWWKFRLKFPRFCAQEGRSHPRKNCKHAPNPIGATFGRKPSIFCSAAGVL